MKNDQLSVQSMDFSISIINLVKDLKAKHESVISNQIGHSGTSIGANIYEANYAQGTNDFVSKLEIALKEVSETGYWLELLYHNMIRFLLLKKIHKICFIILDRENILRR